MLVRDKFHNIIELAIKCIADAESAAAKQREDAKRKAQILLEEAFEENRKCSEQVRLEAEDINREALANAVELGQAEAKALKADCEEMNTIEKNARANMDRAVKLIKERIVNG